MITPVLSTKISKKKGVREEEEASNANNVFGSNRLQQH